MFYSPLSETVNENTDAVVQTAFFFYCGRFLLMHPHWVQAAVTITMATGMQKFEKILMFLPVVFHGFTDMCGHGQE